MDNIFCRTLLLNRVLQKNNYLKLTDACKKLKNKRTGITGRTSTIGENGAYASGSFKVPFLNVP
jgi:hypothetical protein